MLEQIIGLYKGWRVFCTSVSVKLISPLSFFHSAIHDFVYPLAIFLVMFLHIFHQSCTQLWLHVPPFSLFHFSIGTCQVLSFSWHFLFLKMLFSHSSLFASVTHFCLCLPLSIFPFQSLFSFSAFFPVCGPWHSFRPSYPGSGDVRPGLIDQTINYPCITSLLLIACLTSHLRPYREKKRGVGMGSRAGRERESPANC